MKKILSIIICITLILSVLMVPMTVSAASEQSYKTSDYSWDGTGNAVVSGSATRVKTLSDGTVAAVYYVGGQGIYFAKSADNGLTFKNPVRIASNVTHDTYGRLEVQNANFIELKDGKIMAAYRNNTFTGSPETKPWINYHTSICYKISEDGGATWGDEHVAVEWTNTDPNQKHDSSPDHGFWEPDPVYIGDTLFLYYADTVTPTNNEDVCYQHISYVIWNGSEFGVPAIAQNGNTHNSRDGMSVVTKLSDGTYAMVYESTATNDEDITFVVKMSKSTDGIVWSEPVIVSAPEKALAEKSIDRGESASNCNPYIITLPDGRVAVSYNTTDFYNGLTCDYMSYMLGVQVMISNAPVTGTSTESTASFTKVQEKVKEMAENDVTKSACLNYKDGYLFVYYNVGKNTSATTHTFSGINYSYINMLEEVVENGDHLNDYKSYYSSGTATETAEGIQMSAAGNVKLIYGGVDTVVNKTESAIDGLNLYSADTYVTNKTSGITFNADNIACATTTARSYIDSTKDIENISASANIKGNSNGGIYGGFALRTQVDSWNTSATSFYTPGYAVIVKRDTAALKNLVVMVRYNNSTKAVYEKNTTVKDFFTDAKTDCNVVLKVWTDDTYFYATVTNPSNQKTTEEYKYKWDITASNAAYAGTYFENGAFGLTFHGTHTYSNLTLKKLTYTNKDVFKKTAYNAKASADIKIGSTSNQPGFALRVQDAAAEAPGFKGYGLFLVKSGAGFKVQLTRYGTNSAKAERKNLGAIYTSPLLTQFSQNDTITGQTLRLSYVTDGSKIKITVSNPNMPLVAPVEYNCDLADKSVISSVTYTDYYENGAFGIYNHASDALYSNISYQVLPKNISNMTESGFTSYAPTNSEGFVFQNNEYVSKDILTKKLIAINSIAADIDANATFRIGNDGDLKAGIIFRANNIGNNPDDMSGYSCAVFKTPNITTNYSRMVLLFYKWGRNANGKLCYLGTIKSIVDTTSLKSVYPDTENSKLASVGKLVRVNLKVVGDNASATFDILDNDGNVLKSSAELATTLSSGNFASEAVKTNYNAGYYGISMSTRGSVVNFDCIADELSNIADYTLYSSDTNNIIKDSFNNKMYSITGGQKQAVLKGKTVDEFKASCTLKSTSAGVTYNMGFDFGINEATHSGKAYNTNHATMGYEGYRVVLVRNANSSANPEGAALYLFKFTKESNGFVRTQVAAGSNADMFADYTAYGDISVDLNVLYKNGVVTAKATMHDYKSRTVSVTKDIGENVSGSTGWFISGGGAVCSPSVVKDLTDEVINETNSSKGNVYALVNGGSAKVGDIVEIGVTPSSNHYVKDVYYKVDGVNNTVEKVDGKYQFEKTYGATNIAANFGLIADFDDNGTVNALDLANLINYLLNNTEYAEVADVNIDGNVNIIDLIKIKKLLAMGGLSDPNTLKIACVGDSITQGVGATGWQNGISPTCYPSMLQKKYDSSEVSVANFGKGGSYVFYKDGRDSALYYNNTDEYLASKNYDADIVLIMLGTNDCRAMTAQSDYEGFETQFDALVKEYLDLPSHPQVFVVTNANMSIYDEMKNLDYNDRLENIIIPAQKRVAAANNCEVFDLHNDLMTEFSNPSNLSAADGLHPNDAGYEIIANYFATKLSAYISE